MISNSQKIEALKNLKNIEYSFTSMNGYPIITLENDKTEIAFYSEEASKIKSFNRLKTIETLQQFFLKNLNNIYEINDLNKKIHIMNTKESIAFFNLNTNAAFSLTMKKHLYGMLHIMTDHEILLFSFSDIKNKHEDIEKIFFKNQKSMDLVDFNESKYYILLQKTLTELYKRGDILPEGHFIDGAFLKVKPHIEKQIYYSFSLKENDIYPSHKIKI